MKNSLTESKSTVNNNNPNFKISESALKQSGILMRDTFSKLHNDFSSLKSSDSDRDPYDSEEKKKRKEICMKMLMSRDSTFGGAGLRVDTKNSS